MLALDSTIGCIEVSESEVVELYRSAPITRSPSPKSRPESMETYLCAIRRKPQQVKVYLAFVVNDSKIYVYTSPDKGKSDQEYPKEMEKALECATEMGFRLERVDLSYSPAMREVVVRNTKILRLPGSKGSGALKHGLAGAPVLPIGRGAAEDLLDTGGAAPGKIPTPPPAQAPAAAEKHGKPAPGDDTQLRKALAEVKQERQTLVAERDTLVNQLRQVSRQHHDAATELAGLKESHARLSAERESLLPLRRQVDELLPAKDAEISRQQEQIARQQERIEQLREQVEQLQGQVGALGGNLEQTAGRHADLAREHDAMVENLALARQDLSRLAAERDSERQKAELAAELHREAAARLDEVSQELCNRKSEAEAASQRARELEERQESWEKELAELRSELDRIVAERDRIVAERDEALERATAPEERKEPAEPDLAALRREVAQVAAEKDAALRRLATLEERKGAGEEGLAALHRELAQVGAQRDAAVERAAALQGQQGEAEAEIAALRRELDELRQRDRDRDRQQAAAAAAAAPLPSPAVPPEDEQFPQRILQGLQDSGGESRPAFSESSFPAFHDLDTPQDEHAWDTPEPEQVGAAPAAGVEFPSLGEPASFFVPLGDLQGGFFSGGEQGEPVRFLLETALTAIDCPSADDVLELHHSINNAYLAPEGTGGQESCQGYICCLRKKEGRQVFAAIYGTKSRRTWVYLPEAQPGDDDSYARTVRGAISFAEEVGLMMEPVPLEGDAAKREERLKRCPVLRLAGGK